MKKDAREFLAQLLDAPSPSGYEGPARRVWLARVADVADETSVDVHGNAIATLNPGGSPRVMLAGHMDELGFQIHHIDDNGMLRFRPIGGHDMRQLTGRRVLVHTAKGAIVGVIGQRPIHLIRDRKTHNAPKYHELWIDCGFADGKEAKRNVDIGDPATYQESFAMLRGEIAVARGFDNRAGAFVVAEVLRALKGAKGLKAQVTAVATVQEEIGLRGARTAAYGIDPEVGIAVDVTWATDNPGGEARVIGECKLGAGPVLTRGPNINPPLYDMLRTAARRGKISLQHRALPAGSGTDANAIQITRAGVATALLGVPQRYMHSPVELCHLGDLDATVRLIAGTIRQMKPTTSFIPE
ncbi:MAG: M42 family metallopeptidase [Myxococcales bacterium]|nr:M42 family metallopeptidase [Myxococcales bacterium]